MRVPLRLHTYLYTYIHIIVHSFSFCERFPDISGPQNIIQCFVSQGWSRVSVRASGPECFSLWMFCPPPFLSGRFITGISRSQSSIICGETAGCQQINSSQTIITFHTQVFLEAINASSKDREDKIKNFRGENRAHRLNR